MTDESSNVPKPGDIRSEDKEESRRFWTVGGLVDRTSVSLGLVGDDLDPDEISRILGTSPTRAHRKGDRIISQSPHAPRDARRRSGAWILIVRGQAPKGPEELTKELLEQVPSDEAIWDDLADRFWTRLFYGLFLEEWNRGFDLSPKLVAQIARMRLEMGFDIYASLDEEDG